MKTPKQALNPAFLKQKPDRKEIELFKQEFISLLDKINDTESEEFHKNLIIDFLNSVYYKNNHYINTYGRTDLVIHNEKDTKSPVGVLIEVKKPTNKSEMISKENLNAKAFQELVLYYLRERKANKNLELRYLIITNINEWFIFDAQDFKKLFYDDKKFVDLFEQFQDKRSDDSSTNHFYKEIAFPQIEKVKDQIPYTHFDIRDYDKIMRNKDKEDDRKLIALYKFLSPIHLLKLHFAKDYNELNKEFYAELLHILGLEEVKEKSQKFIVRKPKVKRDNGSIIENAINELDAMDKLSMLSNVKQYGNTYEDQLYNVALDLSITWVNRVLFLKLLEAQIVKYQNGDKSYSFLSTDKIDGYDDLNSLFFQILARKEDERREGNLKEKFSHVPYLNSSLFEPTELEGYTIAISGLQDKAKIELYSKSVLKTKGQVEKKLTPLEYLLRFLDAYDFSSESSEDIKEEDKALISASVLGLIFEKINGYKDGSFFTPSFITMFMCRDTITRTVIQKFNEIKGWECKTIIDLHNKISDIKEANEIFNSIRLCDPAVGSGHFLVSSLNEIIYLKSELGILTDREGKLLRGYKISVENDELIVSDNEYGIFKYNPHHHESHRVQETLFHEKQTIIENCLFGVDLNPNSVKICQLRLWIELLKHTYYKSGTKQLETLPNIDINIKCGNSLISKYPVKIGQSIEKNVDKRTSFGKLISEYKRIVLEYKNANEKHKKKEVTNALLRIKSQIFQNVQLELFEDNSKALESDIYKHSLEWMIEFPEVLDEEGKFIGFDAVLGNPPYIRIQGIKDSSPKEAEAYNKLYDSATGSYDIYALFSERSLDLVKDQGIVNFIMPVKWTNAAFGKGLRSVVSQNKAMSKIINFGSFLIFDASTYTGLQWFKKNSDILEYIETPETISTSEELIVYLDRISEKPFNNISTDKLTESQWVLSDGAVMNILEKLNKQSRRISDVFDKIFQGLATSKDDVYFLYNCKLEDKYVTGYSKYLSNQVKIERDLVKPLLKGEDVHRYEPVISDRFVIFPYKKEDESAILYTEEELATNFPLGYTYLKECETTLRGREKGRLEKDNYWYKYIYPKNLVLFDNEKLVAPEISKGGNFSYDYKGEYYSTTTVYGYIKKIDVPESYKCLQGILNSNLFWWYLVNTGTVLANGYFRFKPDYMKSFPIPSFIPLTIEKKIMDYVDRIATSKSNNNSQEYSLYEKNIDQIVYSLYDLTDDEIRLIESIVG